MKPPRRCACSGVRWCARCLDPGLRRAWKLDPPQPRPAALAGPAPPCEHEVVRFDAARGHAPGLPDFAGLRVIEDFLEPGEARALLAAIERLPFRPAQSGKQKQHFGPRINFNRRRVDVRDFAGLPAWAHALEARLRETLGGRADDPALSAALAEYRSTDVFVLRYRRCERSNLDLHVDDRWAYGELILDLSLESDSVLTFVHPGRPGAPIVRADLPARSLALLYGPARSEWEHGVMDFDIAGRRTSVTLRTLGREPRASEAGRQVLARAGARGTA